MKIAIVEICEANHYTAVEALALTYASDPKNEVSIYTLPTFNVFQQLAVHTNISLTNKPNGANIIQFLQQINNIGYDVIHINTISKNYPQFTAVVWKNLILTIHNVDVWFDNPLKKQLTLLKYRLKNNKGGLKKRVYLPIKYFFKENSWQKKRSTMVATIKSEKQKVLVYSNSQKACLANYLPANQIIVFPFCVRQATEDLSVENKVLRVCVPGSVDNHRRDYNELFEMLKQNKSDYAGKICIDLLGYIPKHESKLVPKIEELKMLGIDIIYNTDFIDEATYSRRLQLADIILGNLKASLNEQSKYGETKETGVVFNMIKAAKPGIFPSTYIIDELLKPICLVYDNDLHPLLLGLLADNAQIYLLKQKALQIAMHYEPHNLYSKLIAQLNN